MKTILFYMIMLLSLGAQAADGEGTVRLRKTAKPDNSFNEPAFAAYTRPSGKASTYQIQGAFGYLSGQSASENDFLGNEVDWLIDLELGKNTLASKEQDFRKFNIGWLFTPKPTKDIIGSIIGGDQVKPSSSGVNLLWGLGLSYQDDEIKDKSTALLQLDGALVIDKLQTARLQITPRAGIFFGEILDAPMPQFEGRTSAVFAELGLSWTLQPQILLTSNLKYFAELTSPGRDENNYDYVDASIRYLFYAPGASGFKPSLGLSRVVGEDPRSGLPDDAYTRLAIELQY